MTEPAPDWLDIEPTETPSASKRRRSRKSKAARTRKKSGEVDIRASKSIPRECARRFGPGRIWGCDGNFVFFRPKRMIDGVWTQVANPAAMERHERYLRLGHYVYIETQDDVQIYRVTDKSPFKRKYGSLMEIETGQLRRVIVMAAVKHEWATYCDALEEMAHRIQREAAASDGQGFGTLHRNQWQEMLKYIEIQIAQRGGPTPQMCAHYLQNERIKRGDGRDRKILLPG